MSQQVNIVINDGQATPVARTYSARGAGEKMATWIDVSGGIGIGMSKLTLGYTANPNANGAYKTELRLTLPQMETISGSDGGYTPVPKVAFSGFAKVEFVCPNRSTLQNRKDLLALVKNALANAVVTDTVVDFNQPF